jgi:hypothetical protein
MLSLVVILLGTFVLGGIAYTYTHRPSALIDTLALVRSRFQPIFSSARKPNKGMVPTAGTGGGRDRDRGSLGGTDVTLRAVRYEGQ